jgi:hypothetical protein
VPNEEDVLSNLSRARARSRRCADVREESQESSRPQVARPLRRRAINIRHRAMHVRKRPVSFRRSFKAISGPLADRADRFFSMCGVRDTEIPPATLTISGTSDGDKDNLVPISETRGIPYTLVGAQLPSQNPAMEIL